MYKDVPYNKYIQEVYEYLPGGLFLTTCAEKVNTMVVGWGGINICWGKPVFLVPVRKSRYTYELLEQSGEFTISIPVNKDLRKALAFCGTKSGRNYDKFKECGLTAIPGRIVKTPIIGDCTLHYECKVVYKQELISDNLNKEINNMYYPDYHTFYFGEILACYLID